MTTPATFLDVPPRPPDPDTPVISPERVLATFTGPATPYCSSIWPLTALNDNPSAGNFFVHWETFPSSTRDEMQLIAWTMINGALPNSFLIGKAPSWRARQSPGAIYATIQLWRGLAEWLMQQGITTLGAVSAQVHADYALSVKDQGLSRGTVNKTLAALTRLWAFDQLSANPSGIEEPPWEREGVDDYLPAATAAGENDTDPITAQTMGPLLIWAMRMVDDFAEDVLTAWNERQHLFQTAQSHASTPQGMRQLRAFRDTLAAGDLPVPAAHEEDTTTGCAATYIAAITGAAVPQVHNAARRWGWRQSVQQRPGPCPLDIPVIGTLDGTPWRAAIDFGETASLMRHLGTACFIVIAYLTGMRPGEILGLRAGACPDPEEGRHLIRGNIYKTARDEDGNHLSSGRLRDVPWVAITPVVNAIRVLERMVPDGALLFAHGFHDFPRPRPGAGSLTLKTMRGRIEDFVEWANVETARLERPGEAIPPDRHGAVGTARFRRTLAWHIARRPGGLVALAIQYGHMRTAVSAGYASRGRDGIHELLDIETARATVDTVSDLHADLEAGGGISGPAARRAINAAAQAPRFEGVVISHGQARKLLANPDFAVYDNPHALLLCVFKKDKALCHREGTKDAPSLDHCVSTCANIARTDHQADQLRLRAADLEKKAAHVPEPLGERFCANASRLREAADRHQRDRTTLKETTQ